MSNIFGDTRLFINGERVNGEGDVFAVINPGTEECLGELRGASAAQVEKAVQSARAAFDSGVWSSLPDSERIQILRRFMDSLASQRERLIELAVREAGCPVSSQVMMAQVHMPLHHGYQILDLHSKLPAFEENPLPFNERVNPRGAVGQSVRRYLPIGVVAAISAYNFPFYTNLWKVMPALVTGNTVILRPSPFTPFAALIFGEAAEAAGLPRGVLNVIAEKTASGGITLSNHPLVDMVAFTGSSGVGQQVMIQGALTMKRIQLEL